MTKTLLWLAGLSLGGVVALSTYAMIIGSYGSFRVLILLSLLGFTIGCVITAILLHFIRIYRRVTLCGLIGVAVSQTTYNILVWSGWKTQTTPWRLWWISMVASLFFTHITLLLAARRDGRDRICDLASWSAFIAAIAIAALAIRSDLLESLPLMWLIAIWIPAATSVVSSVFIVFRRIRDGYPLKVPPGGKPCLIVFSHLVVLLIGLYIGSINREFTTTETRNVSPLANLDENEMATQLDHDLTRLRTIVAGLEDLAPRMQLSVSRCRSRMHSEDRSYLLPEEDEEVRWYFVTYLSYRTALLRLVGAHAGFEAIRDPDRKAQSFMIGYAAAMSVYRSGLQLVLAYGEDPLIRRKLNEAEPAWGIPAGMFDRIYEGVSVDHHEELCEEMAAYFEMQRHRWRDAQIWNLKDFDWLVAEIVNSLEVVRNRNIDRHRRWFDLVVEKVRHDAYTPMYAVQSMVADWIGDIRVVDRPRFIDLKTITELKPQLRPGDILLERRSWNASNAFLPGFWPHVALYVGTSDDLARLGILDAPEVASRLSAFTTPGPDNAPFTIIEALGEGVIFNTLEHSLHADYAAALRPRLSDEQIAEAIVRAFRHQGKPYDFEFDFFTSDKLVCTELVYRAYQDLLHFDLLRVMGRDTLPALEMVRKFARELNSSSRELDLVFFLDADPSREMVFFADEQTFIASADRPREFNE